MSIEKAIERFESMVKVHGHRRTASILDVSVGAVSGWVRVGTVIMVLNTGPNGEPEPWENKKRKSK